MVNTKVAGGDVGEEKSVLDKILEVGKRCRQLGIYLYILHWYTQHGEGIDFGRLHRFYNSMAGRAVTVSAVSRMLDVLKVKGLVEERGGRYYPKVLDLDAVKDLFDVKRSRAGRLGAIGRVRMELRRKVEPMTVEVEVPRNIKYYVGRVVKEAVDLVKKGKMAEALDLISHTLLPLRENGVLWLWWKNQFVYYEPKTKPGLHSVKVPLVSELLKKLGFEEGIMVEHVRGHGYVEELIHRLFGKGHLSWPWSRSIFYGLKKVGLAEEGTPYIVEMFYEEGWLKVILKDLYGNTLKVFEREWSGELPPPLSEKRHYKSVAIGKQHVYEPNEEGYFSRW